MSSERRRDWRDLRAARATVIWAPRRSREESGERVGTAARSGSEAGPGRRGCEGAGIGNGGARDCHVGPFLVGENVPWRVDRTKGPVLDWERPPTC